MLTVLKNQLEKIDSKLIESCDEYNTKNDIIQSISAVGNVVVFNLINEMPELGYINNKEAASLVAVAMMSAIQCNPTFKRLYQRLVTVGKPKKVAIIACIRNARDHTKFDGQRWCLLGS